jgi:HNH endonuclease
VSTARHLPGKRTYELLRRHIARLGLDSSHLPKVERRRRTRRWTDDDLRSVVAASTSYAEVLRALGYNASGGMHRYISSCIKELGLDTTHVTGQTWNRGRRYARGARAIPLEEVLVENSSYRYTATLRKRLIAAGLKQSRCEMCGINEWRGSPLPLALDHINGDPSDNRLENLRIVCPNCHALTDTWCARNRKKPA